MPACEPIGRQRPSASHGDVTSRPRPHGERRAMVRTQPAGTLVAPPLTEPTRYDDAPDVRVGAAGGDDPSTAAGERSVNRHTSRSRYVGRPVEGSARDVIRPLPRATGELARPLLDERP